MLFNDVYGSLCKHISTVLAPFRPDRLKCMLKRDV